jgi:hypothetical protein
VAPIRELLHQRVADERFINGAGLAGNVFCAGSHTKHLLKNKKSPLRIT